MARTGFCLAWLWAGAVLAPAAPRVELSLNGSWEYRVVPELASGPPKTGWKPFAVPGMLRGYDYERAWFRRSFTVPAALRGKRVTLAFGGVKFNSQVHLNGQRVGGCFGGYEPFELDVSDALRLDRPNELVVGCHDWTGVFAPGKVDLSAVRGGSELRQVPRDKILSPVGGLIEMYGLWDDVTLVAHEPVYLKDLFIKPSVRKGELAVEYIVANESAADTEVDLDAAVEDAGRIALNLGNARVRVAAGQTVTQTLRAAWPDPRLWSPQDPHLYHLRTRLSSGDEMRTRFGFREFWTEGGNFMLNGKQVHLLATSGWPARGTVKREAIRRTWEGVKAAGCVAFRTHTQPWRRVYYDVADEVGLLIIIEGAVFNDDDTYRIHDPVFWDNYAGHLQAMVRNHQNHPSVVMWSLENEFWGSRLNDASPAKADLMRLGQRVKQWDPTRPMFYESDGDPGDVADVIGIHYPHEYPFVTCWPNESWWLSQPKELGHRFNNGEPEFFWRKHKPLYIGEFLWIPSHDPSWNTVFLGDAAYIDYHHQRNLAKAESWKMQILGYRHFGVSGMCPWTMMEGGSMHEDGSFDTNHSLYQAVRYAYQPIAAYSHDYDRRFYGGDQVSRRVEIFNDVIEPSDLSLAWALTMNRQVVDRGQREVRLEPAGQQMFNVTLSMPRVQQRTPIDWELTLTRKGQRVFQDTHRYAVFPRPALPQVSARMGLFDPLGKTRALFDAHGVRPATVASLDKLDPALEMLVIGAGALRAEATRETVIGREHPRRAALLEFVRQGGRLLVLEQDAYPEGLLDVSPSAHQSTMTFPLRPSHPALRQVEPDDLKFWRGDHLVTRAELRRPDRGGPLPIIVSGSVAGLDHTPLQEDFVGRGCRVFCQLQLVEKFASEPAAARILANVLEYLDSFHPLPRKMAVIGGTKDYHDHLRNLGFRFDDLTGRIGGIELSAYALVLCRGGIEEAERLRPFVERGGNLVVHRPTPERLAALAQMFDLDLQSQPYPNQVSRAETVHPLFEAVTREDLYWLGESVTTGWSTTPRAVHVAEGIFTHALDSKTAQTNEVEDWQLTGQIVERRPPGVTFATVGTATADIAFPETGGYIIGAVARGTPCQGVYPVIRVTIDDEPLGYIAISGDQWQAVSTFGRIQQGRRKVTLAFVNDQSNPPAEDRNLYMDKVLIARLDEQRGITFLTSPPTTAVVQRGRGMVVLDQLRWDTEQRNSRKAARYASSLLAALGAQAVTRHGVVVECEQMTPDPKLTQFRQEGGYAALASSGTIRTRIQVAASGPYTMELVAAGSPAEDVYPLVDVHLDGRKVGSIQLTQDGWRAYPLALELTEGTHELGLSFVNDRYIPGVADRNVQMDKAVFYRP